MSTATVTPQAAVAKHQAEEFLQDKLSPEMKYRPIHLTYETLVAMLAEFRERNMW